MGPTAVLVMCCVAGDGVGALLVFLAVMSAPTVTHSAVLSGRQPMLCRAVCFAADGL
jgi:hypothetical protein